MHNEFLSTAHLPSLQMTCWTIGCWMYPLSQTKPHLESCFPEQGSRKCPCMNVFSHELIAKKEHA